MAAREFAEESMEIFGCENVLKEKLSTSLKVELVESNAVEYLLKLDWKEDRTAPRFFNNFRQGLLKCTEPDAKLIGFHKIPSCPKGSMEKVKMAWVKYSKLRDKLIFNIDPSSTEALPPPIHEIVEEFHVPWRRTFVKSFIAMHKLGIFDKFH